MGRAAFEKQQFWLAWVTIAFGIGWVIAAFSVPFTVKMPGKDVVFGRADGNTMVLVREYTDYTTRLGFTYGERPIMMWFFTIVPILLAAIWLYRGYRDDWQFFHK